MPFKRLLLAFLLMGSTTSAQGHEFRPSLLEIIEHAPGKITSVFRVARWGKGYQNIRLVRPDGCTGKADPVSWEEDYRVVREHWQCGLALAAHTLTVAGLDQHGTDVVVQVELADGRRLQGLITSTSPGFQVGLDSNAAGTFWRYLGLGFWHVLVGADHVLFVAGLTLLAALRWKALLAAITAFTVAHSLTLGLAVLGYLSVAQAPAELVIAISVLLLALQIQRRGVQLDLWQFSVMAFACGLFHGLGFAGAFREVGTSESFLWLSLASFNAGVEVAQVLVVLLVSIAIAILHKVSTVTWTVRIENLTASVLGGMALNWSLGRMPAVLMG